MKSSFFLMAAGLLVATIALRGEASSESYANYMQGMAEERAGHYKEALAAYQKVVQEDSQAIEVYRDIASLSLRLGQSDDALSAAQRVCDLAPTDPMSYIFLGDVLITRNDLTKASDAFQKALQIDPNNLRALEDLGHYYATVDPDQGLQYFNRYLAIDPGDPEMYYQVGMLQEKRHDLASAVTNFKQSEALAPDQAAPHLALADIYDEQTSTAAAIAEYLQTTQLDPRDPTVFMKLGRLYFLDGQFDQAMSQFQSAKAIAPEEPRIYYWMSRAAEELKDWPEAAADAQKAYELTHDAQFLSLTAYYLSLAHQEAQATLWLEKALQADPSNATIPLLLGVDYIDLGKFARAREVLADAVARHPNDALLHFQLGTAEDHLNHWPQAESEFETVLKLDPKNAEAMNYLGYSWVEHNERLPEAETMVRQAVAIEPDNGAYLDSLGWVLFHEGHTAEAITALEKSIALLPDPLIYDHLGDAYQAAGRWESAADAWNKSLGMDPKNDRVRKKERAAELHVLPGSDQRKYLKYIEGNMRQILLLRANVSVKGRWNKQRVKVAGLLSYARPDRLVFRLDGTGSPQAPRLCLSSGTVTVDPPDYTAVLQTVPTDPLPIVSGVFSGALLTPLDNDAVIVSTSAQEIHYEGLAGRQAWIDAAHGLLTHLIQANLRGGNDDVRFDEYQVIGGLWVPSHIDMENQTLGWQAHLVFSNWTINDSSIEKDMPTP